MGLRVFALASSHAKRKLALSRGAEIAFAPDDDIKFKLRTILAPAKGLDLVYDPVGGERSQAWLRLLGDHGTYLVVGFAGGIGNVSLNHVLLRNRSVIGVEWGPWAERNPNVNSVLMEEVVEAVADGRLRPPPPTIYPLEGAVEALTALLDRRIAGKLALIP